MKQYTLDPHNKWHQIVKAQFDEIRETQQSLQKNSTRLWKPPLAEVVPGETFPGLHRWCNEDWEDCCKAVVKDPEACRRLQGDSTLYQTMETAMLAIKRARDNNIKDGNRILDTKIYKATQWKLMMMLRELYMDMNGLTELDIKRELNTTPSKNNYGDLFDEE
jgi:hypothetical protein